MLRLYSVRNVHKTIAPYSKFHECLEQFNFFSELSFVLFLGSMFCLQSNQNGF